MELYPPNFAEFPSLSMSSSARVSARAPAWCNCTSSRQHVPIAAWAIFGFQRMTGSPKKILKRNGAKMICLKNVSCVGIGHFLFRYPKKIGPLQRPKKTAPGSGWAGQNLALHHFAGRLALEIHRLTRERPKKRLEYFIELDDGKNYKKALYLMVKTMVSCRFSLKPIQWILNGYEWIWMDMNG